MRDFETLAAAHKDAVYRQLIRSCGNHEDAEDVLIEALLKAYAHRDQLKEHEAFQAWLAQIGRRVCWNLKAREKLRPVMQLSALEDEGHQPADARPSPEVLAEREQQRAILQAAVAQLPADQQIVYTLRDLEGVSGADVADRLGISLAAQKSRLHRARQAVRTFLDTRLTVESGADLRGPDRHLGPPSLQKHS